MKAKLMVLIILLLFSCLLSNASAFVVWENDVNNNYQSLTNVHPSATAAVSASFQSFQGDGNYLFSAWFCLSKILSPVGFVRAALYAHSGTFGSTSVPTGAALELSINSLQISTLTGVYVLCGFNFSGSSLLTAGTNYTIVLYAENATTLNASNYVRVQMQTTDIKSGNQGRFLSSAWDPEAGDLRAHVFSDDDGVLTNGFFIYDHSNWTTNDLSLPFVFGWTNSSVEDQEISDATWGVTEEAVKKYDSSSTSTGDPTLGGNQENTIFAWILGATFESGWNNNISQLMSSNSSGLFTDYGYVNEGAYIIEPGEVVGNLGNAKVQDNEYFAYLYGVTFEFSWAFNASAKKLASSDLLRTDPHLFNKGLYLPFTQLIRSSSSSGGSISPSGDVAAPIGENYTFTITPDENWNVSAIYVDGSSVGYATEYTFANVTTPHRIHAVFTPILSTGGVSFTAQVSQDSDDCVKLYNGTGWEFATNSMDDKIGYNTAVDYLRGSGLRFGTVQIPSGSIILSAHLELYYGADYGIDLETVNCNARISGEAVADAATFSTMEDFDGRDHTSAVVNWTDIDPFYQGNWYNSPSITAIIQEIVNGTGWETGNDLALFMEDFDDLSAHVDLTTRVGYAYERGAATAPKLVISYVVAGEGGTTIIDDPHAPSDLAVWIVASLILIPTGILLIWMVTRKR